MDPERFDAYLVAAAVQYKNEYAAISSQDDLVDPQMYSRKFVVSMPEYVGGLQFDHVLILDVNDDLTAEEVSPFHRAHFMHDLYLGSSRARNHLEIHACMQDGGLSALMKRAIQLGVLKETPYRCRKGLSSDPGVHQRMFVVQDDNLPFFRIFMVNVK